VFVAVPLDLVSLIVGGIQNEQSQVHSPTHPLRSWWFGPGLPNFSIMSRIWSWVGMPGVVGLTGWAGILGAVGMAGLAGGCASDWANTGAIPMPIMAAAVNSARVVILQSPWWFGGKRPVGEHGNTPRLPDPSSP
jgi:hypothetical protein